MTTQTRNNAGNALVIMAAGLVVFLLLAGTVVDFGMRFLVRQQLQQNCDAAALAGAQELTDATKAEQKAAQYYALGFATNAPAQTPTSCSGGTADTVCYRIAGDLVSVTTPYTKTNSSVPPARLIQVTAKRNIGLFFARMVGISSIDVSASATAQRKPVVAGIIVLDPTGSKALDMSGGSWLHVTNGAVIVDSSDPTAFSISSGSAGIQAKEIDITGDYRASGGSENNLTPTPKTGQTPTPDPLASLPEPSPSGMNVYPGGDYSGKTLQPGVYTSEVDVRRAATLNPGIYILQGGIRLSGGADIIGNGVMLYSQGPMDFSGGSTIQLSPPAAGTYAGITMFLQRRNTAKVTLSGSSDSVLAGAYYFPNTQLLDLSGGSSLQIGAIVTWRMTLSGGSFEIGPIAGTAGGGVSLVD
jgi:Flp pilus assembly protein TadG